jgi:hypothetical protein
LAFNSLSGTIPDALVLNPYSYLDVSFNQLSGTIPTSFSATRLATFNAQYNALTGTIPPLSPQFSNVYLSGNRLTGSFPVILTNRTIDLSSLYLASNLLSGTIPPSFGLVVATFNVIQSLDLSNNLFEGTISYIEPGINLQQIDLSLNNFNGTLKPLENVKGLLSLVAYSNSFTGSFNLSNWNSILKIDLHSNQLSGDFPDLGVASHLALRDFDISFNNFSGTLPNSDAWSSLNSLFSFNVQGNQFSGQIPDAIGSLLSNDINLSSNKLQGTIPESLFKIAALNSLSLANNKLNGTLPDTFNSLREFYELDLQFNELTGTLPQSLTTLKFLKTLKLNSNHFEGDIPPLSSLISLEVLSLDNNKLTGTIPRALGLLSMLSELALDNNRLSGTIPASFNDLKNVKTLTLQNNNLGGTVPTSLDSLRNLRRLNLANNRMLGYFSPTMPLLECNLAGNNFCCGDTIASSFSLSLPCALEKKQVMQNETIDATVQYQSLDVAEGITLVLGLSASVTTQCLNVRGDIVASVSTSSATMNEILVTPLTFSFSYQTLANQTVSVYEEQRCREFSAELTAYPPNEASQGRINMFISGTDVPNCSNLEQTTVLILAFVLGIGLPLIIALIVVVVLWRKGRLRRNVRTTISAEMLATLADKSFLTPISSIKFERELGSGSFGKVFIGKWRQTTVALKVCNVPSKMEDFLQEAALMMKLTPHPNVVQLLAISIDGPEPVIVLEFCEEGSLDTMLFDSNTVITDEMKVKFASGIARGMLHLHTNNLVHRDLAARNVLLQRGVPKVSDFGMSRLLQTDVATKTYSNIGPIRWMAPESLKNRTYSTKSDVWMFGIVLTEIASQSEPHVDKDPLDVGAQIRDKGVRPEMPEVMHPLLKSLIDMCLQYEPNDRPDFDAICQFIDSHK